MGNRDNDGRLLVSIVKEILRELGISSHGPKHPEAFRELIWRTIFAKVQTLSPATLGRIACLGIEGYNEETNPLPEHDEQIMYTMYQAHADMDGTPNTLPFPKNASGRILVEWVAATAILTEMLARFERENERENERAFQEHKYSHKR
ncbi:hypothetical protein EXS71_02270 [Candidatus Uhrbacteria bacterium]|nr:hypothetical protein [Candidatus Uhrbacteria bacterium]